VGCSASPLLVSSNSGINSTEVSTSLYTIFSQLSHLASSQRDPLTDPLHVSFIEGSTSYCSVFHTVIVPQEMLPPIDNNVTHIGRQVVACRIADILYVIRLSALMFVHRFVVHLHDNNGRLELLRIALSDDSNKWH
jgi:hypothetical protein